MSKRLETVKGMLEANRAILMDPALKAEDRIKFAMQLASAIFKKVFEGWDIQSQEVIVITQAIGLLLALHPSRDGKVYCQCGSENWMPRAQEIVMVAIHGLEDLRTAEKGT